LQDMKRLNCAFRHRLFAERLISILSTTQQLNEVWRLAFTLEKG